MFVDINWYEQDKSWVSEEHSEVRAFKFCPNCWQYGKKCIIQQLARVLIFYMINRTWDILVSINSSCIFLFLERTWSIWILENQNRYFWHEFCMGNGLHGGDSNDGSAQRCHRVQTKQSTISLLQSYKLLVS